MVRDMNQSNKIQERNIFKNVNKRKTPEEKAAERNVPPMIIEIDGLCAMLNIGKNTAYNLLTSNEIDSFKVGSVWKIPVSSVNEYIDRKCKESGLVRMYEIINRNRDLHFERYGDIPIMRHEY